MWEKNWSGFFRYIFTKWNQFYLPGRAWRCDIINRYFRAVKSVRLQNFLLNKFEAKITWPRITNTKIKLMAISTQKITEKNSITMNNFVSNENQSNWKIWFPMIFFCSFIVLKRKKEVQYVCVSCDTINIYRRLGQHEIKSYKKVKTGLATCADMGSPLRAARYKWKAGEGG